MNVAAVIEARMTSSRLPGKVLMPAGGKPLLAHLVERLQRAPSIHRVVLATTVNGTDDVLAQFAKDHGIACHRGSEEDVMARVIGAADSVAADVVVGITGDCPLIDPVLVEQLVRMYLHNRCDYASNCEVRGYPEGMDTQVYALAALKRSAAMTGDALDHEHVTLHMRNHPELFRHLYLVAPQDLAWPELHLSVDEQPDYVLVKTLIEHFGPANRFFGCRDIIQALRAHPEWVKINAHVQLKGDH
ncbi:MAG TPA: glycosyltransferase family protein [Burkholderiales bacterium]|nr:glycosyltransferase family protein [Burkholderiales bacterium]